MQKINLGFIGTGIATNELHWPALKKLKSKYIFAAACNRRRNKAEVFAKKAGITNVVNNAEELLALKEVEVVLISMPIHLTASYVIKALKAGKHVISEKPIAAHVGEARKLVQTAAKYKKKFMVAENWYFWDMATQMRAWVAQGKIGRPRLVEVNQSMQIDTRNMYYQTKWRQKPGHLGGFLVDGGVHISNTIREMFGQPKKVHSLISKLNPLLPPADTMLSIFKLNKAVQGIWKYSFALPDTGVPIITVQGDKGSVTLGWGETVLKRNGAKIKKFHSKENSYYSEFNHFYDVILKGKPLAFKPRQALGDLEFMNTLLKAK